MGFGRVLINYRSTLILVLAPILALPLPIVYGNSEAACGYCIIVMAAYWISECLPLAVTSFLPLILFPLMGIMSAEETSREYMKDTNWLFVGGLIIAVAVEHTNLHRRIALSVLLFVGTSPRSLMLGFMLPTYFLSMWISNTATTAMMVPIANAVLSELRNDQTKKGKFDMESDEIVESTVESPSNPQRHDDVQLQDIQKRIEQTEKVGTSFFSNTHAIEKDQDQDETLSKTDLRSEASDSVESGEVNDEIDAEADEDERKTTTIDKGLTICVPYAASIGGISTLTGTGPNLVLSGQYRILFPDAEPPLTFGNWIAYHLPISFSMLVLAYLWLMWLYLGIQWSETTVVIILTSTVLLWFFREPGFMKGWGELFIYDYVSDGTVAMTMAVLLFILPSTKPKFLGKRPDDPNDFRPVPAILDWKTVNRMMPWSVVFLLGGGFALAKGATESGFSDWLAEQLSFLDGIPDWVICLIVTIITCLFTECTSNVATASLFVPIIAQLAQVIEVHPLYLLLPTVVATSLAFMLPVATPPNAIAFSYGYLKVIDLVKAGWVLNLLGVLILMLFINTYANVIYQVNEFPEWASLNYTG